MKKKEPLSPKEENFCRFFVASREPRASAARAGYSVHPERTAMRLLADPEIKRRIAKLENERDAKLAEVTEGYRRLAFGERCGRSEAHLSDELPDGSEISWTWRWYRISNARRRRNRGGQIFRSAQGARQTLRLSNAAAGENSDFLSALDRSARALRGDDAGE